MAKAYLKIMKKGDKVLSVTQTFIAIQRRSGEVDLIPLLVDEDSLLRIDESGIVTIGYGAGSVSVEMDNGVRCETF